MLNSRRLLILRSVVQEGSLTQASDVLRLTVSAVSQQLAALEVEAGSQLFEKDGRGVRPTAAGLVLAEHAEWILRAIQAAEADLADLREGRIGRIRVVAFPSAGESLLPEAIAVVNQAFPDVLVRPTVAENAGALRRVRSAEVELVVVVEPFGPGDDPDDDLHRWHLLEDEYRILLPEGHRLAGQDIVAVGDLADEDWIVTTGPDDYVRATTVDVCRRAGFIPRVGAESDEFPVTQGFVAARMGVALVPLLALVAVRQGVLVRRLEPTPEPRHIWLATRPALREQPAVRALMQALQAAATRTK